MRAHGEGVRGSPDITGAKVVPSLGFFERLMRWRGGQVGQVLEDIQLCARVRGSWTCRRGHIGQVMAV